MKYVSEREVCQKQVITILLMLALKSDVFINQPCKQWCQTLFTISFLFGSMDNKVAKLCRLFTVILFHCDKRFYRWTQFAFAVNKLLIFFRLSFILPHSSITKMLRFHFQLFIGRTSSIVIIPVSLGKSCPLNSTLRIWLPNGVITTFIPFDSDFFFVYMRVSLLNASNLASIAYLEQKPYVTTIIRHLIKWCVLF